VRNSIVEGEPGIFPDPLARAFGAINRWVRRRGKRDKVSSEESPSAPRPEESSAQGPAPAADPPEGGG